MNDRLLRALAKLLKWAIETLHRHWRRSFEAEARARASSREVQAQQIRDAVGDRIRRNGNRELREDDGFKRGN